jgi:hypothetical protein
MDLEALARSTGFQIRRQRKIDLGDLVLGILALVAAGRLSFERVAASVARCAQQRYSKQALHKRLKATVLRFLMAVFIRSVQPALGEITRQGLFAPFRRVLLHDSTTVRLPQRYARDFPGSANQHRAFSQLKIQVVADLLEGHLQQVALSGFTRNDQRASADILPLLEPGDLVIRDLGYFVLSVFHEIAQRQAFFLSRYRHEVTLLDPATHRPIRLAQQLKKYGSFDGPVLLGEKAQVPVRLVARAVPTAVANQRRRLLRRNRDTTLHPSREHLCLLGWNIFVTNVAADLWPPEVFPALYRFRWRIETLFKAWKSHLRLTQLSTQCLSMIHLSVMTKLIFCAFLYRTCQALELSSPAHRHASLLRTAHILSGLALCFEAAVLGLPPQLLLSQLLLQHAFYESRLDRCNFQQNLASVLSP